MAKLEWDKVGERLYETGTSKGVLAVQDDKGLAAESVAWNGLISVKQSPDGAEPSDLYADDIKYLSLTSAENFKGSIEAYTYPDEFNACDGVLEITPGLSVGQQQRAQFNFSYKTLIGNDTMGTRFGYKIHLVWNAKVQPSERAYETVNNDPNALTFSWEFTTTPISIEGIDPVAYMCVDSTTIPKDKLTSLEELLYGGTAKFPTPQEVIALVKPVNPVVGG